jgi:hypothetical protein
VEEVAGIELRTCHTRGSSQQCKLGCHFFTSMKFYRESYFQLNLELRSHCL